MMSLLRLVYRLIIRPLWRESARTLLTIFAVALGVGVVIAMDLAGQSAAEGFHESVESLAGNADAEITMTGGIDEQYLARLVQLPYPYAFSARIQDFAFLPHRGEAIPFLGLDLIGDPSLRKLRPSNSNTNPINDPAPIWVGPQLAWHKGQHVQLILNDRLQNFTVEGVLEGDKKQLSGSNFILADIGLAQLVTGKAGRLDQITATLPKGVHFDAAERVLRSVLPPSAAIEPRGTRREQNQRMLDAFRWNLRILSYISLLVGAFLIYNTISISVVRRRVDIGVVRALGMTRRMVLFSFLMEAVFFGIVGSAIGVGLGRLMANGAVAMVNGTVQALYVTSQAGAIALSIPALCSGVGLGLAISLLAALAPAIEASRVPPVEAMARGRIEYVIGTHWRITLPIVVACTVLAAVLAKLPAIGGQPIFGYLAVLFLIAATAAATPGTVALFTGWASSLAARLMQVEALLAARALRASLGRTSILAAALTTAIAMTASVGIMVGSFRQTLAVWMDEQLKADLYLRPAAQPGADRYPTMSIDVAQQISKLPSVAGLDLFRSYPLVYKNLPTTLAGGNLSRILALPIESEMSGETLASMGAKLSYGNYAFVSEPFASKHDIHPGSRLLLPLGGADRAFTVLAIYYDYSSERGLIMLDRDTLLRYLPDPNLSSLAVYLKPAANVNDARRQIDRIIDGRAIYIADNAELHHAALGIVDNTFRITYALEAVAIFVAVMGVAGALLSLVIDRKREFALLRFLGAAQSQVRGVILCEAALLGLLSIALGLVLGSVLSLILIFVINKQSFGWTLQFYWPVAVLLTTLTGVYLATLVSALYPSRIAVRLNPIEVIHEE